MAHRYVPNTYNNRRVLRVLTGVILTVVLTIALLFLILFFVFQNYVVDGQLQIPWLPDEFPVIDNSQQDPEYVIESIISSTPPPETDTSGTDNNTGYMNGDDSTEENTEYTDNGDDSETPSTPDTYTLKQIEEALQPQFAVSAFGERNPQVVSVKEVERDRDTIRFDSTPTAPIIDLTSSLRYVVEFAFDQPYEEFMIWEEINRNAESKPYRRDGDRTIMTEHYYFNDENGSPVLAFIRQ